MLKTLTLLFLMTLSSHAVYDKESILWEVDDIRKKMSFCFYSDTHKSEQEYLEKKERIIVRTQKGMLERTLERGEVTHDYYKELMSYIQDISLIKLGLVK